MTLSTVRRKLSKIKKNLIENRDKFLYLKYLSLWNRHNVYIVGTPMHTNVGDNAIAYAEIAFLESIGIKRKHIKEITITEYIQYYGLLSQKLKSPRRLILMHGGGNMGNQWLSEELFRRKVMRRLCENPMVIFPQTFFYTSDKNGNKEFQRSVFYYDNRKKLTITAREKESFLRMRRAYPNTRVICTPDIVLSMDPAQFSFENAKRQGVLFMMRSDGEQVITDAEKESLLNLVKKLNKHYRISDMITDFSVNKDNRRDIIVDKLEEFRRAECIITDRLHAMVFAAISETPCIVLTNNNHKIAGTYDWIKNLPYIWFVEDSKEVEEYMKKAFSLEHDSIKYDFSAYSPYYEDLKKAILRYI